MKMKSCFAGLLCLVLLLWTTPSNADKVTFLAPTLDRWSYPFAGNGAEEEARIFSALGTEGFDERDSQFVVAFNTLSGGSSTIPSALGVTHYQIAAARLVATVSSVVGQPAFDGTHDTVATYLPATADSAQPDGDLGRPIELFGAGFVAGYTSFGFTTTDGAPPAYEEKNPFGFGPPTGRYVHPLAFNATGQPLLVTNHVDYLNDGAGAFEASPFAVGISSLAAGALLAPGTELTFEIDLTNPAIVDYLRSGLDRGQLGFVLSTLSTSDNFPRLFTKEFAGGSPVRMELDVTIVPEPSAIFLAAASMLSLAGVVWSQLRRRPA